MVDFDPLYSTAHIKAIEQFINKHYALEAPVSCTLLHRGFNDVYRVHAGNHARYVFRLSHHRARGPADVRSETAFLRHLLKANLPVAAPVPTRDGVLFLQGDAAEGAREGALFQAIDGRDTDASNAGDASANGRTLALIHNAAETYAPEATLYRLDLEHLLHRPLVRIKASGLFPDARAFADLQDIAVRTERSLAAFGALTWTYCHGDCHGFNSRINDAGEAVFFDFDDGGPGYLAYDLAVFLWAKVSFGRKLTKMWGAFIDGYKTARPITPDDLEAALQFVIVRHIWLMGEYASRTSEWGSNTVGWIAGEIDFLKAWENEQLNNRLF